MRNGSKGYYVNETLSDFTCTATTLNIARIRRECVCKDQEVVRTFCDQFGFVGSVRPLAIVAGMAKRNAL